MTKKSTYWSPFSPGLKWPLRLIGAFTILGVLWNWLHIYLAQIQNPDLALKAFFTGLSFFCLSFRKPRLRSLAEADMKLERALGVILLITVVGLGITIFLSISAPH